ncbi:hypothetical protein R6Q57_019365 [Mikania cordata]
MTEAPPAPTPLAPFIIRNFIIPLIIFTHKSLLNLTHKFKPLEFIRYAIVTVLLFFLKIIPSFIPSALNPNSNHNSGVNSSSESDFDFDSDSGGYLWVPFLKVSGKNNDAGDGGLGGDTCIARALSQLLAIINEIPVSSRKYEIVRGYAEKLMDENLEEEYEPLRKVNSTALSAAFSRALGQLEVAVETAAAVSSGEDVVKKSGYFELKRVMKAVGCIGSWTGFAKRRTRLGRSAEKLAAELLWLAQKLAACGAADEAVRQWASASKLALMAVSAQPQLQGSLVKLSVFLFKQAVCMGGEDNEEGTMDELRKIKMKMLMSWLPFLCRSSIGTDAPLLSFNEKTELENVLGELIGSLKHEEEQEKVLSLWLHHFTHCPSSDWPNLHLYYARWCTTSRKILILEGK